MRVFIIDTSNMAAEEWLANEEQVLTPSCFSPIRIAWRVFVEPPWAATAIGAIRPSAVEKWIRELTQGKAVTVRVRQGKAGKPGSAGVVLRAVGILAGILRRSPPRQAALSTRSGRRPDAVDCGRFISTPPLGRNHP